MSDSEDNMASEPPVIDPYEVLSLERSATTDQIKKAYRKASLKTHPGTSGLAQIMTETQSRRIPLHIYVCRCSSYNSFN